VALALQSSPEHLDPNDKDLMEDDSKGNPNNEEDLEDLIELVDAMTLGHYQNEIKQEAIARKKASMTENYPKNG